MGSHTFYVLLEKVGNTVMELFSLDLCVSRYVLIMFNGMFICILITFNLLYNLPSMIQTLYIFSIGAR